MLDFFPSNFFSLLMEFKHPDPRTLHFSIELMKRNSQIRKLEVLLFLLDLDLNLKLLNYFNFILQFERFTDFLQLSRISEHLLFHFGAKFYFQHSLQQIFHF